MYKKIAVNGVEKQMIQRTTDGAFIPFSETNTDYQEYLKWLEEGNTVLPPDEPVND